jgi:hypothetical protein
MKRRLKIAWGTGCCLLALGLGAPARPGQQAQTAAPASPGPLPQAAEQTPSETAKGGTSGGAPVPSASSDATKSQPAKGASIEVPSGTHIPLLLHNAISTHSAKPGDPVYFETIFPVMVDGHVVIPVGTYVSGEVTEAKRPGRVKGRAELMVKLTTMILPNAYMVNLAASPSGAGTGGGETVNNEGKVIGDTDKASDIGTVMKTTAAGAGIGAIASQSGKGAGIGAGVGAAAGLVGVLLSRGPDAELPRGTTLEAILDRPIYLEADKVQFTSLGQSTASSVAGPPNREPVRSKNPF